VYFETSNTVYTRAQALVWVANGLSELHLFEKSSGKLLSQIIDNLDEHKSLLVNFKGIVRFDDHSLDEVYDSLKDNKKQLVILNGEQLFLELNRLKKGKEVNINHDTSNKIIVLGNSKTVKIIDFLQEKEQCVEKYVIQVLQSTFTPSNEYKRLSSTPFLANGEFNSKKIIESPRDFMWFSFYMSDKLDEIIKSEKLTDIVLVSSSLRGAIFTSILGILNNLEYVNIDHIGPIHKVYDFESLNIAHQDRNYFYVGDFVFGGTEIKLTKVYASFIGAKLNHALVLGSLFDSEVFKDFKLHELHTLHKIREEADYKLFDKK